MIVVQIVVCLNNSRPHAWRIPPTVEWVHSHQTLNHETYSFVFFFAMTHSHQHNLPCGICLSTRFGRHVAPASISCHNSFSSYTHP